MATNKGAKITAPIQLWNQTHTEYWELHPQLSSQAVLVDASNTTLDTYLHNLRTELTNEETTTQNHRNNVSNPHSVTKSQVGLGNCDNTSDLNKPISTATQTALNAKQPKTMSAAIVVNGTSQTTVEGTLGALNTYANLKANSSDVYTQTQCNTNFAPNTAQLAQTTDWNNLTLDKTFLYVESTINVTQNCPLNITAKWFVHTTKYSNHALMIAYQIEDPSSRFIRTKNNGTWTSWSYAFTSPSIDPNA